MYDHFLKITMADGSVHHICHTCIWFYNERVVEDVLKGKVIIKDNDTYLLTQNVVSIEFIRN